MAEIIHKPIRRRAAVATMLAVPAVAALPAIAAVDDDAEREFMAAAVELERMIRASISSHLHWMSIRAEIDARPDCPKVGVPRFVSVYETQSTRDASDHRTAFREQHGDREACDAHNAAANAKLAAEQEFLDMRAPTAACVRERVKLALLFFAEHEEVSVENA